MNSCRPTTNYIKNNNKGTKILHYLLGKDFSAMALRNSEIKCLEFFFNILFMLPGDVFVLDSVFFLFCTDFQGAVEGEIKNFVTYYYLYVLLFLVVVLF